MTPSARTPKYLAEALGTFCLVFSGTGAVVVDQVTGGKVTGVGIGLVFGLVVLAMIYAIGHISGAHMNPAVTLGFAAAGRLPRREVAPYVAAQFAGALAASFAVKLIFLGQASALGATVPAGSWVQSFVLEAVLTFMLMFVVMGVSTDHRAQGAMAGIAVGATVAMEAIFAGPISGASMNPARSLASALLAGILKDQWIYAAAPVLGAVLGALAYQAVRCDSGSTASSGACC